MSRKKNEDPKPRKVQIVFEVEENQTKCCECLFVMHALTLALSATSSTVPSMTWEQWY